MIAGAMKKFLVLLLAASMTSCAAVMPGGHTTGFMIQNVKTGGAPVFVEGEPLVLDGLKTGAANEYSILGIISFGDSSIMAASKEGGLRSVHYVDRAAFSCLGVFAKYTTRVAGK